MNTRYIIKEKHVTRICGIPLIETCVSIPENYGVQPSPQKPIIRGETPEPTPSTGHENQSKQHPADDQALPISDMSVVLIIGTILTLVLAYFMFQHIAVRNCPDKLHLDNTETSLHECEAKLSKEERALTVTREQNEKLKKDIAKITAERTELSRKLIEGKTELNTLKTELELANQQEGELQEENKNLKSEKATITKDLDATKYTLGNCKNKNMDHEVRSLELLQEIEGLKKELKAC